MVPKASKARADAAIPGPVGGQARQRRGTRQAAAPALPAAATAPGAGRAAPPPRATGFSRRPDTVFPGFIKLCQPSKVALPPSGKLWVHEIKHDGYRLLVRRDGSRVRCFTQNGSGWADRFPTIVDAASRIRASVQSTVRSVIRSRGHEAVLYAFDLIEHIGADLRDLPLIERKRRLNRLLGRAERRGAPSSTACI